MAPDREPDHRPPVLVRGDGTTVWNAEGNAHQDLLSGIYSVNAGYRRRRIVEAMTASLEALPFVPCLVDRPDARAGTETESG